MRNDQWAALNELVNETLPAKPLTGFIVDSPWLPGWNGLSVLDYYTNDSAWFETNKKVVELFPDILFFPGFWSEYGMCTEPSGFGAKLVWAPHNLPHAEKVIHEIGNISKLTKPNVQTDGLLPFMISRVMNYRKAIEAMDHSVKMAVSRGPLNIASFLMGATELMMTLITDRKAVILFLELITEFIIDWLRFQKKQVDSIEGILILDDIVGFIGEDDFRELALPCLKGIFAAFPSKVNLFHNDAHGLVCAPYLKEAGVHIFNFSFEHGLAEMQALTGNSVVLLGNIPPRDVMAQGTMEDVKKSLTEARAAIEDPRKIIWSVGGGMPQGVLTENVRVFADTVAGF